MAEICCDVVGKTEPPVAACEASPAARRRRMGIRRFKLVAGVGAVDPAEEMRRKRRRFGCSASTVLAVDIHDAGVLEEEAGSELVPGRGILRQDVAYCPPRYGMMSVCGRRRDMEDAVSIRPDFDRRAHGSDDGSHHFFGVYDGHGCSHVAVLCKDRMHEFVADEISKLGPAPRPSSAWSGLMKRSFSLMDSLVEAQRVDGADRPTTCCRCEFQAPRIDNVGSTAVVAVVGSTSIVVANCGDSRAVLSRSGAPVPLSSDHKPDRPDELSRIEAAGGRVIYWEGARVLGVLAMSRAIGDGYLKPYVISEPEVTVTERRDDDEFLILASDGLWDVVTNEMACDVVRACLRAQAPGKRPVGLEWSDAGDRQTACSDAATLLTKLALARQSADNISVVVVDLRRPGKML